MACGDRRVNDILSTGSYGTDVEEQHSMLMHAITLAALFAQGHPPSRLDEFLHHYGALALFIFVFLQDVGVPTGLPGTVLVMIGGYLVYTHVVTLNAAALAIAAGAFLGATGMFFLARYGGRPLVLKLGKPVGLTSARLDVAARALDRVGPPMLLITRVAPGTRVYMTIFAGISGWTYRRFALWTGIFVLLWSYGFVILGDALGPQWERVARAIGRVSYLLLFILLGLAVVYFIVRLLINNPRTKEGAFAQGLGRGLDALRLRRFFTPAAPPDAPVASDTAIPPDETSRPDGASDQQQHLLSSTGADAPGP
jgi:membrane protein DedA with SNARE-associated domain